MEFPMADTNNPAQTTKRSGAKSKTAKAKSGAKKVVRAAENTASQAAENLSHNASTLASTYIAEARDAANEMADQGKNQAKDVVRSLGRALEAGYQSLEDDGYPGTAGYVRAAAQGLHGAADSVDGFDTRSITQRVEGFVREKPLIAAGGLALAGFILASVVKAPNRR